MYTVKYWRGTLQLEGKATTARGVARICARNRNAYDPKIYDAQGKRLHLTYETVVPGRKTVPVLWDEDGNAV